MANSVCKPCNQRISTTAPICTCKCSEIYHVKCFNNIKTCFNCKCDKLECNEEYENNLSQSQNQINMRSLKRTPLKPSLFNYLTNWIRIPFLLFHFLKFYCNYAFKIRYKTMMNFILNKINYYFSTNMTLYLEEYNREDLNIFLKGICYWLNIHVKVHGLEKIDDKQKKVYIGNHISYHEVLTIPRFFVSNPIASLSASQNPLGKIMAKYSNVLVVKRGTSSNTVEQMNEFIEKYNNVFIFPQGIFSGYRSLTKYRTGGFATDFPVQPILSHYTQNVTNMKMLDIVFFDRVDLDVYILDAIERKENESVTEYTERVRKLMANFKGYELSDVESRDVKD